MCDQSLGKQEGGGGEAERQPVVISSHTDAHNQPTVEFWEPVSLIALRCGHGTGASVKTCHRPSLSDDGAIYVGGAKKAVVASLFV